MATAPTTTDLVHRASELVPLLRKNADWSEEHRCLHDETVEAVAAAGLLRMRVPARHGGYECGMRTQAEVTAELARGDAATAWSVAVWTVPGWMAGLFPDEVQDEVFATPDVRVCGTLSPSATATPGPGGYQVSGKWGFISGAKHSHWQVVLAMAPTPEGVGQRPVMGLVPLPELAWILRDLGGWRVWWLC